MTGLEDAAFDQLQQGCTQLQPGSLELQDDLNSHESLFGDLDDDACNFDDLHSQGYSVFTSGLADVRLEAGTGVVADISACVGAAFSMLPVIPPNQFGSRVSGLTFLVMAIS